MQIWLGVKDFAKIEEAKICLGDYVLFVGQNNCGKTFLMQLIQGVTERLADFIDPRALRILSDEKEEAYRSYVISSENISQLADHLNKRLHAEKENLVKEIFQRKIPIGELYVDLRLREDFAYKFYVLNLKKGFKKHLEKMVQPDKFNEIFDLLRSMKVDHVCILNYVNLKSGKMKTFSLSGMLSPTKVVNHSFLLRNSFRDGVMKSDSLFFPASRTGLLLLYREYFLNKTDRTISYKIGEDQAMENNQDYGGLTKPVYEFLRFLQGFSENEDAKKKFQDELRFFEDNVINGHISADRQKTFLYQPKNDKNEVPMYLASSMINEVAPIGMAITGGEDYDRFIIDEVESSLHPEKQFELARFFNRLVRKGKKLMISTHSDTFVSKMNNLYILSHYNQGLGRNIAEVRRGTSLETGGGDHFDHLKFIDDLNPEEHEALVKKREAMRAFWEKHGLTAKDLIDPGSLLVYEFVLQDNGKSVVKEIPGDKKRGFQFDLFASSAVRLYDEALDIGELPE